MFYLFLQTWIWILVAGLLGLVIGWLIWGRETGLLREQLDRCRGKVQRLESAADATSLSASMDEQSDIPMSSDSTSPESSTPARMHEETELVEVREEWKPEFLDGPDGQADDLKRIKGVGPVIQKTLNELGIYHFHQIAAFTDDNVKWMDNYIAFPGRIHREGWVAQAADLATGEKTDSTNTYDQ